MFKIGKSTFRRNMYSCKSHWPCEEHICRKKDISVESSGIRSENLSLHHLTFLSLKWTAFVRWIVRIERTKCFWRLFSNRLYICDRLLMHIFMSLPLRTKTNLMPWLCKHFAALRKSSCMCVSCGITIMSILFLRQMFFGSDLAMKHNCQCKCA